MAIGRRHLERWSRRCLQRRLDSGKIVSNWNGRSLLSCRRVLRYGREAMTGRSRRHSQVKMIVGRRKNAVSYRSRDADHRTCCLYRTVRQSRLGRSCIGSCRKHSTDCCRNCRMGNQRRVDSAYAVADASVATGCPLDVDHQGGDWAWCVRFAEFLRNGLEPEIMFSS